MIHKTASIDSSSSIGKNTKISSFVTIEKDVVIGENCEIDSCSIIKSGTTIGNNCCIGSHTSLGGDPQDTSFDKSTKTFVKIGNNCTIKELVTIHRASKENEATILEDGCFVMNNSHVGHDCVIRKNSILSVGALLGGFVVVGENCFISVNAVVHQRCRIGNFAFVSPYSMVRKDILPYCLVHGESKPKHLKLNNVSLQRNNFDKEEIRKIKFVIFKLLKNRKEINWSEYLGSNFSYLKEFIDSSSSRGGIHGFSVGKSK
jgi:UDP-N-acetylglucosamine acyltransferase